MNGWEWYQKHWLPAQRVVSDMERVGVLLDQEACPAQAAECQAQKDMIEPWLNEWAKRPVNWSSTQQVAQFLYEEKGFPVPAICGSTRAVKRTKQGKTPADEMACIHLARTLPNEVDQQMLRAYVGWRDKPSMSDIPAWKIINTRQRFFNLLPRHVAPDGRVHPQLSTIENDDDSITGTETGRNSCKNPNLQNQPGSVRSVFIAPPGKVLIVKDYAGLEWRILAHILKARYKDSSLVDDIVAGVDPHSATALKLYAQLGRPLNCSLAEVQKLFPKERDAAKIINYSVNYGKTAMGLAIQLGITEEEAEMLLQAFFTSNPGIEQWLKDCVTYARLRGYARSLLGRYRYIPELKDPSKWVRAKGERLAMNSPIQMSAADIMAMAMVGCSHHYNKKLAKLQCLLILQVHDELVFECPEENAEEASELIEHHMVNCLDGVREFLCPLGADGGHGRNWKIAKYG